ncbi:DUF3558 family protein [Corynebacterium sp. MSK041]|uniref:DUF3558 family protein n=1 Tax=Corynebacterium sp. MSK041 TaxID=3050194 RepID=UPI00254DFBBA|nr:DUF3558 family protein [Corynebacterium sp. MSK041]MDK8795369.1 DUF3558 family protein [Corynebacterium sp. MSK041]
MKHRGFSYITGVMLTAALTGCTPFQDTGETTAEPHGTIDTATPAEASESHTASQTGAPAFHFASGDLVLGDFDYNAIKDNLFNPCTEISAEEFAVVGLEPLEAQSVLPGGGVGCGLVSDVRGQYLAIGTSAATREDLELQPDSNVRDADSTVIPGLILYRGTETASASCVSAVDTTRGQFSIIVADADQSVGEQTLCSTAQSIMESFFGT